MNNLIESLMEAQNQRKSLEKLREQEQRALQSRIEEMQNYYKIVYDSLWMHLWGKSHLLRCLFRHFLFLFFFDLANGQVLRVKYLVKNLFAVLACDDFDLLLLHLHILLLQCLHNCSKTFRLGLPSLACFLEFSSSHEFLLLFLLGLLHEAGLNVNTWIPATCWLLSWLESWTIFFWTWRLFCKP